MRLETYLPLLFDLLIKSVVVLLLAAGAALICRRSSAANRHTVWLAALCTLALLPITKCANPRWAYNLKATVESALAGAPEIVSKTVLPMVRTNAAAQVTAETPSSLRTELNWPATGVVLWLAGVLVLLARRATVSWRMRRLVGRSVAAIDERALAMTETLAAEAGVLFHVRVSEQCRVPLAFGVWRSLVLAPRQAFTWSDARLAAALRHEVGHLRRGDCLTRLLSDLLCAVYWVNPLIWIAARSLRVAQEQACDDLVLCSGTDAADYASQLVDVVRSLGADRISTQYALAMAQPSTLETRVRSIVDETRDRRPPSRRIAVGGALAVMAILALCGAAQLSAAGKPGQTEASTGASSQADLNAPQVEIESKFIEIAEDAVDAVKAAGLPVSQGPDAAPCGVAGILTEKQAQPVFKVLNQTKGVDVLSSPRVTTLSKQQAVVEVGREFRYATKFTKGETPGTWKPKAFETKNVGITLQVKPTVTAEGTINLLLAPEVVKFLGFIDLNDGGKSERLADTPPPAGHRSKPIFSTRKATISVALRDGETTVLNIGPDNKTPVIKADKQRLVMLVTAKLVKREATELERAGKILVPKVEFQDASLRVVLEYLRKESIGLDPEHKGVNILIPAADKDDARITLNLRNVPIAEILKYVAALTGLELASDSSAIHLKAPEAKPAESPKPAAQTTPAPGTPETAPSETAKGFILPHMEFKDATVDQCVEFVRQKCLSLNPAKKGVTIAVKHSKSSAEARITLTLANISAREALRYVATLAGLELTTQPDGFRLHPAGE